MRDFNGKLSVTACAGTGNGRALEVQLVSED
jgi:hypothetical protein